MADDHDHNFESADAGAANTTPTQCSSLRKGGNVMIKGKPCKIVEMSTSKTGKHGHAKVHLIGLDIFTGKKLEDICPSTHNMDVPNVSRTEWQLIDITDDGYCTLMDEGGETREDLRIPDGEVGVKIKKSYDEGQDLMVTVLKAMGEEVIIDSKTSTK